jgi:uncharacterized membrane protein YfcA
MNQYIIEMLLGLTAGALSGATGILPVGILIIIFEYLGIGNYKSNLGAIALLNLFPISIGSFWNHYKTNNINFSMGFTLLLSIIVGGYFGSMLVVDKRYELSKKQINYLTSVLGFFIGISFLIAAQSE